MRPSTQLRDDQPYCLSEAATFIPSSFGGAICVGTLRRWVAGGFVEHVRRRNPGQCGRPSVFIRGAEIRRLLGLCVTVKRTAGPSQVYPEAERLELERVLNPRRRAAG